jgi:hypothetical protein
VSCLLSVLAFGFWASIKRLYFLLNGLGDHGTFIKPSLVIRPFLQQSAKRENGSESQFEC